MTSNSYCYDEADEEGKSAQVHIPDHSLPVTHLSLSTRSSEQQLVPFGLRSLGRVTGMTRKQY